MKKILTEELIQDNLKDKGISTTIPYQEKYEKVLELNDAEIVHDWDNNCTAFFYEESTADGYGIYIATEEDGNPNMNEDVYYYEAGWFERLAEYIANGYKIYIELGYDEDYQVQEAIEALYEEWYMEEFGEVEDKLLDEGYEWPPVIV